MEDAINFELGANLLYKFWLYQAPLVVLFFMPGVGKVELQTIDAFVRNTVLKYIHSIGHIYAQVAVFAFTGGADYASDPRRMNFNTDEIFFRFLGKHGQQ